MSVIEFEPVYRTDWPLEDEKNRYESDKEWEGNSGFFTPYYIGLCKERKNIS